MSEQPFGRMANGVLARSDGKGDAWANDHRTNIDRACYMQDLDGVMGGVLFERTCAEETFCEFVPDAYANRTSLVREYALVACFERKKHRGLVIGPDGRLLLNISSSFFLWLCRAVGARQPVSPQFFFVFGDGPEWEMTEIDVLTGAVGQTYCYGRGEWRQTWQASGLLRTRQTLKAWLENPAPQAPLPRAPSPDDIPF